MLFGLSQLCYVIFLWLLCFRLQCRGFNKKWIFSCALVFGGCLRVAIFIYNTCLLLPISAI